MSKETAKCNASFSKARLSRDPRFDGLFFVAVKTTGIFCRPICPARLPKEENVEYFHHAETALKEGYRPCFRCRPDSAPSSPAWLGVGATVNRALSLLRQLPLQKVSQIAQRLGISDRYLNKLIVNAIGISPKQYQDMQRALFAKSLIQQSELSMTDIALTSGYQSLRQLQRGVEKYCATTPSSLRKSMDVSSQGVVLFLSYRPPYNWPYVRQFLWRRALAGVERVVEDRYERYFTLGETSGFFSAVHNPTKHGFDVYIELADLTRLYAVIQRIKHVLDLEANPLVIEDSLRQTGLPEQMLTKGLRLPSAWSVFESGCRAIVGQQVSVKAAVGQATLLAHHLGNKVTKTDKHVFFPSAASVAKSNLSFLAMPQARKNALREFAELFTRSQCHFPHTDDSPDHSDILAIKGIGQWTLDYVKMRGERHPDVYLANDLVVRKISEKYPVNANAAAPWRSYLTLQLWQLSE